MYLTRLLWTFITTSAPLVSYEGYDATGHVARRVQFTLCQTAQFEARIATNGVYMLQIRESTNDVWETFGKPILGPITNTQTLSVPKQQPGQPRVFRLLAK